MNKLGIRPEPENKSLKDDNKEKGSDHDGQEESQEKVSKVKENRNKELLASIIFGATGSYEACNLSKLSTHFLYAQKCSRCGKRLRNIKKDGASPSSSPQVTEGGG